MNPIVNDKGEVELRVYGSLANLTEEIRNGINVEATVAPSLTVITWDSIESFVHDMSNYLYDWFHYDVELNAAAQSFVYEAAKEKLKELN